jgi:catechol 2,3-dioxygenase-like lactoylglutathione lyase family enzyme
MEETEQRGRVAVKRIEQVAIVVDDLAAAVAFFTELGLDLEGEATLESDTVDRLCGIDGIRSHIAMMRTPDGHGGIELIKYLAPAGPGVAPGAPPNMPGIRHIVFAVEGIDDVVHRLRSHGAELVGELVQYENSYRLCYLRGPEGIMIELAEELG